MHKKGLAMIQNILIVDDQFEMRRLLRVSLEDNKRILHEANTGDDAWRIVQHLRPCLILLDVMFPGFLDGYQVCKRIKTHSILKHQTRVILMSGLSRSNDVERGMAAECDAYLIKPFTQLILMDAVERVLEGQYDKLPVGDPSRSYSKEMHPQGGMLLS